jgi:hypothetical protein
MTQLDKEIVQQAIDEAFQQIQGGEEAELIMEQWHGLHELFRRLEASQLAQHAVDNPGTRQAADFLAMEAMLLEAMQHLTALQLSLADRKPAARAQHA